MITETFKGHEFQGVVFDGTFETAVEIVNATKSIIGEGKVHNFRIEYRRNIGGILNNRATLYFELAPLLRAHRDQNIQRIISLAEGDCLVITEKDYDIIKRDLFNKFFGKVTPDEN